MKRYPWLADEFSETQQEDYVIDFIFTKLDADVFEDGLRAFLEDAWRDEYFDKFMHEFNLHPTNDAYQKKTLFNYLQETGATWSSKRLEPSAGFYFYELESSSRTSGYTKRHGRDSHRTVMPTSIDLNIENREPASCR